MMSRAQVLRKNQIPRYEVLVSTITSHEQSPARRAESASGRSSSLSCVERPASAPWYRRDHIPHDSPSLSFSDSVERR